MYRDLANSRDVSLSAVRRALPNISLPSNPPDETMASLGYPRIHEAPRPTGDVVTQGESAPDASGVWHQTWEVRDFTAEEAAAALEQAKADATVRINAGLSAEMHAILADYPDAETKTWDKQESEARAYQADATASTPLIDAIATARSMDKTELVSRIIAKADAWIAASGAATGKRQKLEDQIAAATTIDEANAINW
ncbi:hypothetical protein MHM84_03820 [Halomonas sp. McH1-25]|uniref:hypothetical protein n=1 Tax=unclassified Halomonas TaxID=2609666 RepID=UPI001EF3F8DF|nr:MULTISPECIES: hypothetical protein [unclassified Halomonas]MCG7598901.1 hypothetical protein [Halomonas sp. McH1-25]MCP1340864.1 hypothetical protein [Halomonas sp. FL8]MCP1361253.1 hypothetical protein [Halomonas sp. BBD45]